MGFGKYKRMSKQFFVFYDKTNEFLLAPFLDN